MFHVHSKAKFNHHEKPWTSEMAWAKVIYDSLRDEIRVIKVYEQRCKDCDGWVKPYFNPKSMKDLKEKARTKYQGVKMPVTSSGRLKDHKTEMCGRCRELGYSCRERRTDTGIKWSTK